MALGMSKADVAVSKTGIEELVALIESDWNNLKKVVDPKGTDFTTLTKVLDTYWKGTDCENFKNQIKALSTDVNAQAENCKKDEKNAIDKYYNGFIAMQKTISAKIPAGFKS